MNWDQYKTVFEKTYKSFCAGLLIIMGIVGLFLPFIQGIALIVFGAGLLSHIWAQKKIVQLKEKTKD